MPWGFENRKAMLPIRIAESESGDYADYFKV